MFRKNNLRHALVLGALGFGGVLGLTGCIDDKYDLDNVDLTMGLGTDGLGAPVGNTERIYLKDFLSMDGSVDTTATGLYYLYEGGHTNYNISVDDVTTSIDDAQLSTTQRVVDFDKACAELGVPAGAVSLNVPAGQAFSGEATGYSRIDFTVDGVTSDIVRLDEVYMKTPVSLRIEELTSSGMKFAIDRLERGFVIDLPPYLTFSDVDSRWSLSGSRLTLKQDLTIPANGIICSATVTQASLGENGTPVKGSISFKDENDVRVSMDGTVHFKTGGAFTMRSGDYADIRLDITVGNSHVLKVEKVKGVFAPEIAPIIDPIDIASELPDFLQDDDVTVDVSNPTIKFVTNMTSVPVGLNAGAVLTGWTDGKKLQTITLGTSALEANAVNTVYYYQGAAPFDPTASVAGAQKVHVSNLSTLISKLPDEVRVDMGSGRVGVQQKEYTVELGRTYSADVDYDIYVPFEFDGGVRIVYSDSTESIGSDLKDYDADAGVTVKGQTVSTIPLGLTLKVSALDEEGRTLPGVQFNEAQIAAASGLDDEPATGNIEIVGKIDKSQSKLSQIDRFVFRIEANSGEATGTGRQLTSKQYVQLRNVRLRLNGNVTADFN